VTILVTGPVRDAAVQLSISPAAVRRLCARPTEPELIELHTAWCVAGGFASDTTVVDRAEVLGRVSMALGPLLDLTGEQLAGWLSRDGWSAQTKATYHGHLSGFYRWCVDTGRLDVSPIARLRKPRVPKRLPRPVARDVFRRIEAEATGRWLLVALLAAYAGLRCCEIARLHREDITDEVITVVGKGGKMATVPTHVKIWEAVWDLPPGLLMTRPRAGGQCTPEDISRGFAKYLRRELGIEGVTAHMLRHRFGTSVYQQTRDLLVASRLLRHASVATTQGYAEVEDDAPRAAIGRLAI